MGNYFKCRNVVLIHMRSMKQYFRLAKNKSAEGNSFDFVQIRFDVSFEK